MLSKEILSKGFKLNEESFVGFMSKEEVRSECDDIRPFIITRFEDSNRVRVIKYDTLEDKRLKNENLKYVGSRVINIRNKKIGHDFYVDISRISYPENINFYRGFGTSIENNEKYLIQGPVLTSINKNDGLLCGVAITSGEGAADIRVYTKYKLY